MPGLSVAGRRGRVILLEMRVSFGHSGPGCAERDEWGMQRTRNQASGDCGYDVIVLGAGMVGAAVACALGQVGMRVAVLDSVVPPPFQPGSAPDLRVSALNPASVDFLRQLQAWSGIEAMRCCPYRSLAVWEEVAIPVPAPLRRWNRTLFRSEEVGVPMLGYIVENVVIQQALHQVLRGLETVDVRVPSRVEHLSFASDQVSVQLGEGEEISGRLLVGADGARSLVRKESGIRAVSKSYQQRALVATVSLVSGPLDRTWQAFTPTGPRALLPLASSGGTAYASLVWYDLPESVQRLMALSPTAFLAAVRKGFPDELPVVADLVDRAAFPLECSHASHYVRRGLALVGDAAHTINPLAGQGVNLGFQDAMVLTRLLGQKWQQGQDIASVDLLREYEILCRPRNLLMQRVMDGLYHLFSNEVLPLKVMRNLGLAVAGHFPAGRRQVMRYAMGQGIDGKLCELVQSRRFGL